MNPSIPRRLPKQILEVRGRLSAALESLDAEEWTDAKHLGSISGVGNPFAVLHRMHLEGLCRESRILAGGHVTILFARKESAHVEEET